MWSSRSGETPNHVPPNPGSPQDARAVCSPRPTNLPTCSYIEEGMLLCTNLSSRTKQDKMSFKLCPGLRCPCHHLANITWFVSLLSSWTCFPSNPDVSLWSLIPNTNLIQSIKFLGETSHGHLELATLPCPGKKQAINLIKLGGANPGSACLANIAQ